MASVQPVLEYKLLLSGHLFDLELAIESSKKITESQMQLWIPDNSSNVCFFCPWWIVKTLLSSSSFKLPFFHYPFIISRSRGVQSLTKIHSRFGQNWKHPCFQISYSIASLLEDAHFFPGMPVFSFRDAFHSINSWAVRTWSFIS